VFIVAKDDGSDGDNWSYKTSQIITINKSGQTEPGLVVSYDIWPENGAGLTEPAQGLH